MSVFFEPMGQFNLRVFYHLSKNMLVSRDEWVARGTQEIIDILVPGRGVDPRSHLLQVGHLVVGAYNFNPYTHQLYYDDFFFRWCTGQLTFPQAMDWVDRVIYILFLQQQTMDPEGGSLFTLGMVEKSGGQGFEGSGLPKLLIQLLRLSENLKISPKESLEPLIKRFSSDLTSLLLHPSRQDRIAVALCGIDDEMSPHAITLMCSILENTENPVDFYLLIPRSLCPSWVEQMEFLSASYPGCKLHFILVDMGLLQEFKMVLPPGAQNHYVSKETYLRFLLPDLLPTLKKIIYLDLDIIVEGDLLNLWDYPLDGHIIGMVNEPHAELTPAPEGGTSFQAGVILMDLKGMREVGFLDQMKKRSQMELETVGWVYFHDQGLLNRQFGHLIKRLPMIFDFCTTVFSLGNIQPKDDPKVLQVVLGQRLVDQILIYHYAGPQKAWLIPGSRYYKYFDLFSERWYASLTKEGNSCP